MHGIKGVSMTNTSTLTLDGVSFQLPDGSLLFSDLDETFDTRHTGLVGRNGVGKSLLARLLAGHLQPSSGSVRRQGRVRWRSSSIRPSIRPSPTWLASAHGWRRWRGSRRVASTTPTTNAWASAGTSANAWPTPWPPRGSAISARIPRANA